MVLKRGLHSVALRIELVTPPLAGLAIVMIVSSIVGGQTALLRQQGLVLILATCCFTAAAFCSACWFRGWRGRPCRPRGLSASRLG